MRRLCKLQVIMHEPSILTLVLKEVRASNLELQGESFRRDYYLYPKNETGATKPCVLGPGRWVTRRLQAVGHL